jgi:Ca2+-binding RTX toxin-like protein
MVHHIKLATSLDALSGDAFAFSTAVPDSLIVDAGAFLVSESAGDGANLGGAWTVVVNGEVESVTGNAIEIAPVNVTDVFKITIAKTGDVSGATGMQLHESGTLTNKGTVVSTFGVGVLASGGNVAINNSGLIEAAEGATNGVSYSNSAGLLTLVNSGTISTHQPSDFSIISAGTTNIANFGSILGTVLLSPFGDTFVDFKKVGGVVKNGKIVGIVDLAGGDDHFTGGANAETVRDGPGSDVYNLGRGNDGYIAVKTIFGTDGADSINGGSGTDTYDASAATLSVFVNLDKIGHGLIGAHTAYGADVSPSSIVNDHIINFENVVGGSAADFLVGSKGANVLSGGGGADTIEGLGGRDILTGGDGADTFIFEKLSDSGTKTSTRDIITDFTPGVDVIDLSGIDANTKVVGNDAFTWIGPHAFHHQAGELRESFSKGITIISADVNGDGVADFNITLQGHPFLSSADFVL